MKTDERRNQKIGVCRLMIQHHAHV